MTFDPNSQPLHSVENLGKVTYQAYRVELKPATKTPVVRSASARQDFFSNSAARGHV